VAMHVEDYYPQGKRWWVRLHEKGGKRHEMPAHHTLEAYLDAYLDAAQLRDRGKSPLFRSAVWHSGALTDNAMTRIDAYRMVQRRAAAMGLKAHINNHTFRATASRPTWTPAAPSKMPRPWRRMKAPRRPSFTTALAMR